MRVFLASEQKGSCEFLCLEFFCFLYPGDYRELLGKLIEVFYHYHAEILDFFLFYIYIKEIKFGKKVWEIDNHFVSNSMTHKSKRRFSLFKETNCEEVIFDLERNFFPI